jgi:hypothetical protein
MQIFAGSRAFAYKRVLLYSIPFRYIITKEKQNHQNLARLKNRNMCFATSR